MKRLLALLLACILLLCGCAAPQGVGQHPPDSLAASDLTQEQERRVEELLMALSEGMIRYDFDGPEDIHPEGYKGYLSMRYTEFYTVDEAHATHGKKIGDAYFPSMCWLDENQLLPVFKKDFGIDALPFKTEGEDGFIFSFPESVQGRGWNRALKTWLEGDTIYSEVEYEYHLDDRDPGEGIPAAQEKSLALQKVRYAFTIQPDGNIIIKSGLVVH